MYIMENYHKNETKIFISIKVWGYDKIITRSCYYQEHCLSTDMSTGRKYNYLKFLIKERLVPHKILSYYHDI